MLPYKHYKKDHQTKLTEESGGRNILYYIEERR